MLVYCNTTANKSDTHTSSLQVQQDELRDRDGVRRTSWTQGSLIRGGGGRGDCSGRATRNGGESATVTVLQSLKVL